METPSTAENSFSTKPNISIILNPGRYQKVYFINLNEYCIRGYKKKKKKTTPIVSKSFIAC